MFDVHDMIDRPCDVEPPTVAHTDTLSSIVVDASSLHVHVRALSVIHPP